MRNKIILFGLMCCFFSALHDANADDKEFTYDSHNKRDPFWALVSTSGGIMNYNSDLLISEMHLEGIVVGTDGKNVAIINGLVVQINTKVGEYTVTEIRSNAVILYKNNERFELLLKKEE